MLRKLKEKDVPYMLEWMHDKEITQNFRNDFGTYTEVMVKNFIKSSYNDKNRHFAFVDTNDIYLGTISLKNISYQDKNAEYAIVTRRSAQGTGQAYCATKEILEYAFHTLKLEKVYLNVLEENVRANQFYKKCGFELEGQARHHVCINGIFHNLNWYAIIP
jgi:RimJ/RimL family protein N-acetyltransferase